MAPSGASAPPPPAMPPPAIPAADDEPMRTAEAIAPPLAASQTSVPSIVQRPGRDGNVAPAIFPRPERRKTSPPVVTSPPPPYPKLGASEPANSNEGTDATRAAAAPPPPLPSTAPAPPPPLQPPLQPVASADAAPVSDAPPPPIPYGNPPPAPLTGGTAAMAAAPALPIAGDQSLLSRVYAQNLAQQVAGNVSQTMTADGTMIISSAAPGAPASFGASAGISGGPALMVLFTHGGSRLGAASRRDIGALAANLGAYPGYVRIVGHASHRTGNMSQARHLSANFNVSVDRANAVARELMRGGVPSSRLIVEAVSDTQPRYYETMPGGEAENRRVEIFLE